MIQLPSQLNELEVLGLVKELELVEVWLQVVSYTVLTTCAGPFFVDVEFVDGIEPVPSCPGYALASLLNNTTTDTSRGPEHNILISLYWYPLRIVRQDQDG